MMTKLYAKYGPRYFQSQIFKMGYKPSIWLQRSLEDNKHIEELKSLRYPYKVFLSYNNNTINKEKKTIVNYWFFQNKEIKKDFKNLKIHKKILESKLDNINMGRLLGFPPKAVELFSNVNYKKDSSNKIAVDYCGISFMSYKDSIIEDLIWINKKINTSSNEGLFIDIYSHNGNFNKTIKLNKKYDFSKLLEEVKYWLSNENNILDCKRD